ncbi:hypothetical protein ACJMK2_028870 [Sinanodonta woodiana]|uniref:Uncharacterized protein n=1 Tax=Sinanodonta woodiana TaxID=1069815 RepID=A0ABD3X8E8_SINWO
MEWDYCGITKCNRKDENDCSLPKPLTNAKPRYTYTSNGARDSYNSHCPVSQCTKSGWSAASISCSEYTEKRSCTSSGRTCQEWATKYPHDNRHVIYTSLDGSAANVSRSTN